MMNGDIMLNELRLMQNLMNTMLRTAEAQFTEIQRSIQDMSILPIQGLGINIIDNGNEIIATAKVPPNSNVNLTSYRLEISSQNIQAFNQINPINATNNIQSSFYYQSISLPNIDPNRASTSYNNGVLEIRIPKMRLINTRKHLALLPGIVSKNIQR